MYLGEGSSFSSALILARQQQTFIAHFSVTALAAWNATSGNPVLYNGSGPQPAGSPASGTESRVLAVILGFAAGWTTAPGASGVLGLSVGAQASTPTSTTGATAVGNSNPLGPAAPQCNAYNAATITAPLTFLATHEVSTATGNPSQPIWVPLEGLIVIPPGGNAVIAGAAAISTMVGKFSLAWAEIPY